MGSRVHRGSCLCGKVSHSVSGSPILSAYCHCTLCQSLNSAFIHTLHFPSSVFKWTHSEPHEALLESFSVPSRPWKTRWRCKNCGCTVASYNSKADKWSVWGHQLEKDSDGKTKGWAVLQPTAHIFYETRAQDVGDSLGKWTGYEGCTSLTTFQMTPSETISKFRASPWVTYDPPASTSQSQSQNHPSDDEMDEDVDMDAPQISTLREDDSPPPPPPPPPSQSPKKAASTRKTKPLPKSKKPIDWAQIRNSVAERNSPGSEDEPDEPEEEEDQLIDDDDDDDIPKPSPVPTPSSARSTADPSQKKKAAVKRKPRKSEKRPPDAAEKKTREKIPQTSGAPHLVPPTMSWFEANPAEPHDGVVEPEAPVGVEGPLKIKLSVPGKKKTSPRKPPAIPRAKTKALKQKTAIPPLLIEDAGVLSEEYTGTAASSPVTAQFEANSPEPEHEHSRPQSPQAPPSTGMPLLEETNLEGVAIPQYPLPTKPFPVQPPPKMTSGFAPALPLDRSGKKVRRWRTANREIRGIAGGRWFTRTWVGEKESEYAAALLLKAGEEKSSSGGGMTLPKLSNISISAPKAVSKLKASSSKTASLSTSAAPSRSGSSIPEGVTSAVRAPTKMRILQVAASEAGDSDMAPPPDS